MGTTLFVCVSSLREVVNKRTITTCALTLTHPRTAEKQKATKTITSYYLVVGTLFIVITPFRFIHSHSLGTFPNKMPKVKAMIKAPSRFDILCGKGKDCNGSEGSKRYRLVIDSYRQQYARALTRVREAHWRCSSCFRSVNVVVLPC